LFGGPITNRAHTPQILASYTSAGSGI